MRLCARGVLVVILSSLSFMAMEGQPGVPRPIKNRYVVRVHSDQVSSVQFAAHEIANRFQGKVHRVWEGLSSFELEIDDANSVGISAIPFVEFIEQAQEMDPLPSVRRGDFETAGASASAPTAAGFSKFRGLTPNFTSGCPNDQRSIPTGDGRLGPGLDRIDQREGRDGHYYYGRNVGQGVDIYVIGNGIAENHADFKDANGVSRITEWHSVVSDNHGIKDCDSWGTKAASFSAGLHAGAAKGANIIPVKVWGCNAQGNGMLTQSTNDYIAGLNWVRTRPKPRPAIVFFSLWWPSNSGLTNAARDVARAGFFVVTPTGHSQSFQTPTDCRASNFAPGNSSEVFTVGASSVDDVNSYISCMGPEIDLFAPGEAVKGATPNGDWDGQPGSYGPPYAAGYVAGAAAVAAQWIKQKNPNPNYIPSSIEIRAALLNSSTKNTMSLVGPGKDNTTKDMLYTRDFEENYPQTCTNPPDLPSCPIDSIDPRGGYFSSTGGTIRVDVTTDASCTWSAVVEQAARTWMRVRPCGQPEYGVVVTAGSSELCVQIDSNPPPFNPGNPEAASAARSGTIAINDKTFTVNQVGAKPPVCPENSQGPTFGIVGPSSVQRGQDIVLTAYPGEGFLYEWRSSNRNGIISSGPVLYLRAFNGLPYPEEGSSSATYTLTVKSSRCPDGVSVSKSVSVHGTAPGCALPLLLGSDIIAVSSFANEVTIGVYAHPFFPQPGVTFQWYSGASGDEGDPMVGKTSDEIRVPAQHGATYWVKMTNTCGSQLSGTFLIVTQSAPVQPRRRAVRHSVTVGGNTNVMLRNPNTGENFVKAYSAGALVDTVQLPSFTPGWEAQTFSDLDGDERTDIVWRNPSNGQNKYWRMAGTSVLSTIDFDSQDPAWQLGASADYDDDGNMDLVWQNRNTNDLQLWFMNADDHYGTFGLGRLPSGDWKLQGTADFGFDGKPDLMFRNYRTGSNAIWTMNDTIPPGFEDVSQSRSLTTMSTGDGMPGTIIEGLGPNWRVASIDDADGDGRVDITWIDSTNGDMMYWKMNGTQKLTEVPMPRQTDPNLEVTGTPPVDIPPAPAATTLSVTATPATFGDVTTLTASLNAASGGLTGKSVAFRINGSSAGMAFTGDDGTAVVVVSVGQLAGGSYSVTATFAGDATYAASSASTTFTVSAPQVQLTWTAPDSIVYGTSLSAAQLNAIADVAGTFVYTPAAGTILPAGEHTLSVTFTPADQATYGVTSTSVQLTVAKGTPSIHWPAPLSIAFGTPLSAIQLNATSTVAGSFVYDPAAGTILNAGNAQRLRVTFTPSDPNYDPAIAETLIDVTKASQTITWAAPAPIVYGIALSSTQLNATVSTGGSITYTPATGTVLAAGAHTLTATVAETANHQTASATVTLQVGRATPTVQWAQPASIVYGTLLSATQLNATASVAGTFSYTPAAGALLTAGTHTLQAAFTPTDSANYNSASASVQIAVTKATPSITWPAPEAIVYGTALSNAQLNATSAVAGTFTYSPAAGTVLNAGNGQTLSATFTSSDPNYTNAAASVSLNVLKANPVITWAKPSGVVYGTALSATQLNATANVAGGFVYTPAAGTILNAGAAQALSVQFTPNDHSNYEPAGASTTIDVAKAQQTIPWSAPAPIVYGTSLSATQLNATVSVVGPSPAGALTYAPPSGTVLQAGTETLTVTAAATPNYEPASASVSITVLQAKPVLAWAQPASIIYNTLLDSAQLNATANVAGSFTYTPAAGTKLTAGTHTLSVLFTPSDARNYENAGATVTLVVERDTPVLTWPSPASIVYGTALSATQLNATASVAGAFAYTPDAGTILNAGASQPLTAEFTPADTQNYNNATASVTIDVAKANQTLSWTPPQAIVYGTPLSAAQLNATVSVVGPSAAGALVYTPAAGTALDAGPGQTLTVTAQPTPNYESATLSVTIDVNRAPLSLTVDAKSKLYGSAVPALTGTLTGVVNGDNITPSYATTGTQQSVVGTYSITGSLVDPANRLVNYNVTITPSTLTVLPAPLTIVANSVSRQYSDPLPQFTATYIGLVLGESPAVLNGTLSFSTTVTAATAPGQYPLGVSGVASPNYAIQFVSGTLTVLAEDARAYYTGTLSAAPLNGGATAVNLTLSATIKDISATPDAASDTFIGDIRNATATFVDRSNGATLCTAPIGLLNSADTTVGSLTCTATVPLTNITVGVVVSNYYTRDAASDDTVISITSFRNMSAQGTGKLALTQPAGAIGAAGWEASFTLNASTPHSANNEAGNPRFNLDLKGTAGQRYRITSTSLKNLFTDTATNTGSVDVAAVIEDLSTNKKIVLDSDALVRVTFTDSEGNHPPGSIAITIWKKTGGLWLVSNFDGTKAVEQNFTNGEIKVR